MDINGFGIFKFFMQTFQLEYFEGLYRFRKFIRCEIFVNDRQVPLNYLQVNDYIVAFQKQVAVVVSKMILSDV